MHKPVVEPYGENGILIQWPEKIDPQIHNSVVAYQAFIESHYKSEIVETNAGYQSLLVIVKYNRNVDNLIKAIRSAKVERRIINGEKFRYFIPVCYHPDLGLDIETLAQSKNMSIQALADIHTSENYNIYFTGFLPGFLYLGGLDSKLHTPRKATPRLKVPKGSVAIGGRQTGIYPAESPGGWHIIGQTPINLFDATQSPPSVFTSGDRICFFEIDQSDFQLIKQEVQDGTYQIRKEVIDA